VFAKQSELISASVLVKEFLLHRREASVAKHRAAPSFPGISFSIHLLANKVVNKLRLSIRFAFVEVNTPVVIDQYRGQYFLDFNTNSKFNYYVALSIAHSI